MATKKPTDYNELSHELNEIIAYLQSQDTDIDKATKAYERGVAIINELESYIKEAENKVKKVKSAHS